MKYNWGLMHSRVPRLPWRLVAIFVISGLVVAGGLFSLHSVKALAPCPCHVYDAGFNPTSPTVSNDAQPTELGVRFKPEVDGYITGVRFYKDMSMTDAHVGNIWDSSGRLLATGNFTSESSSGWQDLTFSNPVQVTAGTVYTASYFTPSGKYTATLNYFGSDVDNYPLLFPSDTNARNAGFVGNGVYTYNSDSYPNTAAAGTNYWVDVTFRQTIDASAPQVVSTSPTNNTTGYPLGNDTSATFNQNLLASTVTSSTVQMKDNQGNTVSTAVTYDDSTKAINITPTDTQTTNTTYTVTIKGGPGGVANLDGTTLAADYQFSYTSGATDACPCSIWNKGTLTGTPATFTGTGGQTFGVKIHSDSTGYVQAIRFYKSITSTSNSHKVSIWTTGGVQLGTGAGSNESDSGWQEIRLSSPVEITAGTDYVISYYAPDNTHVYSVSGMTSAADNAILHASASGSTYSSGDTFPSSTTVTDAATNFWIDPVFTHGSSYNASLTVKVTQPQDKSFGVGTEQPLTFTMSNPINNTTLSGAVTLTDSNNQTVAGTTSYDATTRMLSFKPMQALSNDMAYTASVGGLLKDVSGTSITPATYSFRTGTAISTDINQGLGGPVLIVTTSSEPYGTYLAEMLRAEGITYFTVKDVSQLSPTLLNQYKVVLLNKMILNGTQVSDITDWVTAGGDLIAMQPDEQLASLLGITDQHTALSEGYLKVDTTQDPGQGITSETMQYHGAAENYQTNAGTRAVASLYSDATTATSNPAVTERAVGSGHAAAFSYDLPKSIALMHQGNPASVGQDTDGNGSVRPDDLFVNGSGGADWLNKTKAHIPQADEQQVLLINMILTETKDSSPLPKFWILPHGHKSALVMMEDDHGTSGGTLDVFNKLLLASPANCSAIDWGCSRGGSLLYTNSGLTPDKANTAQSLGFSMGVHITTGCNAYSDFASLSSMYTSQLSDFAAKYTLLPPQRVNRTHCYIWSDWDSTPKADIAHGIRYNINYELYPPSWTDGNAGYLTGSGMTMRFTDASGSLLDDYQGVTDLDYETDNTSASMDADLDNTINSNAFYGVLGVHYDSSDSYDELLIAAAKARNIPMVNAEQMITWKDALGSSSFTNVTSSASQLKFTTNVAEGGEGMQAMIPATTSAGTLSSLKIAGNATTFTTETIKGVDYATFDAVPGAYVADYGSAPVYKTADINQDGAVDYLDLSALASRYGQSGAGLGRSDINMDGKVDYLDLSTLASQYGT